MAVIKQYAGRLLFVGVLIVMTGLIFTFRPMHLTGRKFWNAPAAKR